MTGSALAPLDGSARAVVQPDLRPNRGKTWRNVDQATDDLPDFELGGGTEEVHGAGGDKAWTVFKTVVGLSDSPRKRTNV